MTAAPEKNIFRPVTVYIQSMQYILTAQIGLELWYLTPLSIIFQLYSG